MQLVLSNNRVISHGENFISMGGGVVINTETGAKYENATIAECSGCPSDIGVVGYEYHAGRFVPCAPFGKGDGNIGVYCDDCKTPRDSGVSVKLVCATSSYMTFVGNVNADMVAAAFGKGNEDEVAGIGKALTMYSHFNGEEIAFSVLQDYDSLYAIGKSQEAINEVLSSVSIVTLMQSNTYSKPYVELWRLNTALPEELRRDSFADIVQDVEVMNYMYDNYTEFEALNILNNTLFVDAAKQYAITTSTVRIKPTTTSEVSLYSKKCFVINLNTVAGDMAHNSEQELRFIARPDGSSVVKSLTRSDILNNPGGTNVHSVCKFASLLSAYWSAATTVSTGDIGDDVYALIIPCE